jgi:N-acetylmuramate 1-kinase
MLEPPRLAEVLVPFVRSFTGGGEGTVDTLAGDASTRRYHRVHVAGGSPPSVVVMELPDEPLKSDEATSPGLGPPELPFLNVQRYLASGGYPVPRVFRHDAQLGLVGLEDLGDLTFEAAVRAETDSGRALHYRAAIELIVSLQALGDRRPDPGCVAFSRRFDQALLRWELAHFKAWYLEAECGVKLDGGEEAVLDAAFDWIAAELAGAPPTLVHRDFQSRNLMVTLLRDSYVVLAPDEVDALVGYFLVSAGIQDAPAFRRLFVLQTLQRKLKDAGRFVFIDRVRKNPNFLRWIPASIGYVREALQVAPDELHPLRDLLGRRIPGLEI